MHILINKTTLSGIVFSMLLFPCGGSATPTTYKPTTPAETKLAASENLPVIYNKGYVLLDKKEGKTQPTQSPQTKLEEDVARSLVNGTSAENDTSPVTSTDKAAAPVTATGELSYEEISKFVTQVRGKLCPANPGGSYEIWVQFEGETPKLFANFSAQAGLKVIVECEEPDQEQKSSKS